MKIQSFNLSISSDGIVTLIYDDDRADLMAEGKTTIARASHVEPQGSEWIADMAPVGGPVLGPYPLRKMALDAEVEWLTRKLFALDCGDGAQTFHPAR
jgi:hypothetical protein